MKFFDKSFHRILLLIFIIAVITTAVFFTNKKTGKSGKLVQQNSEIKNPQTYYQLGISFSDGFDKPKNFKKSFYWMTKAAQTGDQKAQYFLGLMYVSGQGTKKDLTKAFYWYKQAVEQNYASAKLSLGEAYYYGRGVKKNKTLGMYWMKQASANGISLATLELSKINALPGIKARAAAGDAAAQLELSRMYVNDFVLERDMSKARNLLKQAAKGGNQDAIKQFNLFKAYLRIKDSADAGSHNAKQELVDIYLNGYGLGVPVDYLTAATILKTLVTTGKAKPIYQLGMLYYDGKGLTQNFVKAKKLIQQAAEMNYPPAQFQMGKWLLMKGTEETKHKALAWFTKAALNNNPQAQFRLGFIYYQGLGVKRDILKAYAWYQLLVNNKKIYPWYQLNANSEKDSIKRIAKGSIVEMKQRITSIQMQKAEKLFENYLAIIKAKNLVGH